MRENKGFGRTWARRWRIREEDGIALEKSKRTAPVHVQAMLKGPAQEREKKVVITCAEVKQLVSDLGHKPVSARKLRRFAEMLRFDRRDNWT